jgi:crotonobetainyl-CoA:carnitine CoA-transferase CaiB-like acyl-CoA transferase
VSSRFHQAPYGVFKTADGWLTLSLSDGATLAAAFEDPQFTRFSKEDQFDKREEINTLVAQHMQKKTVAQWEDVFAKHGVWNARVQTYDEVLADPQIKINQSVLEFDDPNAGHVRNLAHPVRYDGKAPGLRRNPPTVGQDTDEVLQELGYGADELARFRASGAIGPDRAANPFDRKASAPASIYSKKASR